MAFTEEEAAWEGARAAGATSKEAKFAIWAGALLQRTNTQELARNKSLPQGVVTISASRRRLAGLGPNEMGLHRGNL